MSQRHYLLSSSTVTQAGGGSSVLTLLCAKDQANENYKHMKGIPQHVIPTDISSRPSAPLSWDLSPAKTHGPWLQDLMKLRL